MIRKGLQVLILMSLLAVASLNVSPISSQATVKVGLYYYVWYEEGSGSRHWNSTPPNGENTLLWNAVDEPILGYYDSQNTSTIKQHLDWFSELGIDFLVISWWGPESFEDNTTKKVFSMISQGNYTIQIALMVEAYDRSNNYNITTVYEYLNETYISKYPSIYMRLNFKPLICFYNDVNLTGTEERRLDIHLSDFTGRIVGHNDYADWWFAMPSPANASTTLPLSKTDKVVCIEPRYDNRHINVTPSAAFDSNLIEGLYDQQWIEAMTLADQDKAEYITINSWNEYHERSQIEPHITEGKYVLSLYGKTKSYIDRLRSAGSPSLVSAVFFVAGIVFGIALAWTFHRFRGKESYIKDKTRQETAAKDEAKESQEPSQTQPADETE